MTDKRIVKISSLSVCAALLIAFILSFGESGRIVAAILLLPATVLITLFIKKRNILSMYNKQILLIMTVISLVYVMLYYLSGIKFGFYKNPYALSFGNFFKFFLPTALIIVCTEIIRHVMMAQGSKMANIFCYMSCVIAEMLIVSNIANITSFNKFMDVMAGAFFPAILSNLLYHYLSKRYGMYPNIVFRGVTTLYSYTFPIVSGISDSLLHFFNLLLPIAIYLFIDALYEKKKRYALGNISRFWRVASISLTVLVLIIMTGVVMLTSNQFKYGSLVIATESMTGELNKGDVAIFESYGGDGVEKGQVIVFEKSNAMIVHRVVDIEIINGNTRYYTKGDANEDNDLGYITDADIRGTVSYKIPYFGFPTIWIRGFFKR